MNQLARISEADSLAFHGMAALANNENRFMSVKDISELLQVSYSHLRDVFRWLEKQGLLIGVTGPEGGYKLAKRSDEITLLEIYEAMEGKFKNRDCLLDKRVCRGKECVLGDFVRKMNGEFKEYLAKTRLSKFKGLYPSQKGGKNEKKGNKD